MHSSVVRMMPNQSRTAWLATASVAVVEIVAVWAMWVWLWHDVPAEPAPAPGEWLGSVAFVVLFAVLAALWCVMIWSNETRGRDRTIVSAIAWAFLAITFIPLALSVLIICLLPVGYLFAGL